MLHKIWQWLKNLYQRWFTKPTPPPPPPPPRPDTEYENLFFQLLEQVSQGASRGNVKGFLTYHKVKEAELIAWLRRFRTKLETNPPANPAELSRHLQQLNQLGLGELSSLAGNIAQQLSGGALNPQPPSPREGEGGLSPSPSLGEGFRVRADMRADTPQKQPPHPDAVALFKQGVDLYLAGNIQGALEYWNRALEINPKDHIAWHNKGNAHIELKQYQEAIFCYERALKIDPKNHIAWYNKGNTHAQIELKQYQEAIFCYERALKIDPKNHIAWNGKGTAHIDLKQYQEAISCYERALKIDPNDHDAWNNKGVAHYNLKQYQEAILCYQQALALTDNKYWQAWGNWGWTLLVWQGEDAALAKLDEALQFILPQEDAEGCGRLYQQKGNVYYRKGKKEYDSNKPFINPYPHWLNARSCYLQAKQHLAKPHLPVQYLELLVDLAQVCHALAQLNPDMGQEAADVVTEGITCLERFLSELSSEVDKRFWAQKFITFARLRVDTLLDEGDATAALLAAEHQKNLSLRWMQQNRYVTHPPTATIEQMQQLLAPNRAIIHWHMSDQAITTFILTEALTPKQPPDRVPLPQVRKLENWLKQWKSHYHDYRKGGGKEGKEAGDPSTSSGGSRGAGEQGSRGAGEQGSGEAIFPLNQHPWRVTMAEELGKLGDILEIDKILPHLQNISQLILIPHRDLHLLPLEYFFPQLEITRIPSAYFGLERLDFPATGEESRLSIEYPPSSKPGTLSQNELLFAEAEAGYIAHLYPHSVRIIHRDATKEGVMAAVQANISAQIFHFTGHGVHDLDNPDNSGLQMADGELLTMRDLFDKLQLPPYMLVCLSACETGIASQKDLIDEFVGLTSPFLTAKTTHIVSTLWSVEEISTCILMIEFFRHFRDGKPGNIALAEAKAWLRTATNSKLSQWWEARAEDLTYEHLHYDTFKSRARSAAAANPDECPYNHPYFWAGFTVTGKVN